MAPPAVLVTDRLTLRPWRDADLAPFAALNADPEVMRHFPSTLDPADSAAFARRIRDRLEHEGWGLWAVEVRGAAPFIGFVGLNPPSFQAHFTPCVEIGWRLARDHWGRGYAPEAAAEVLRFGFDELGLDEVVSFTVPANSASRRVMEKIGLHRDPADDFDHPAMPPSSPLCRHVLYRLSAGEWWADG